MKNHLRFVDRESKPEIDALRMGEYAKATGFSVELSTLAWRESDDQSFVLAAESSGRLVSTMRGEIIDDRALLERKLECPWTFAWPLELPVLLLSRAATDSSHRSAGLNLVLRHRFIEFATALGLKAVVGTFVSGSPRENTLREMGYQFFENKIGWTHSTYRSLRPVSVVVLDLERDGERAQRYCFERAEAGLREFPFEGPYPQKRIVSTL